MSRCHFFIHFGLSAYLHSCYEAEIVNCYKMLDKFSVKWDHFQSKWTKTLSELRSSDNFADVSLICDDKVKFSAHKILLSSCSKMLKFILEENQIVQDRFSSSSFTPLLNIEITLEGGA